MASDLFRLERTLVGERLVPVATAAEATHAAIALVWRISEERTQEVTRLQSAQDHAEQRVHDLEVKIARAIHRVDQAESVAAQMTQTAAKLRDQLSQQQRTVQKLAEKNTEVIGEKRKLHNAVIGKYPLPAQHYRIDLDRDGDAYETLLFVLETFPHREHRHAALREAREKAQRHNGRLRALRLDTAAWRAIVQVPVGAS